MPERLNQPDSAGKASLTSIPPVALIQQARVHVFGSGKEDRGPYSWRQQEVSIHLLIDKVFRHLLQFLAGDDVDDESGEHHAAHAIADLNILLDAEAAGCLVDDRFPIADVAAMVNGRAKAQPA